MRRRRRSVSLAALSLALVAFVIAFNVSALSENHQEEQLADDQAAAAAAATASAHGGFGSGTMQRSLLRHINSRRDGREASTSTTATEDEVATASTTTAVAANYHPIGEVEPGEMEAIPSPAPSVRQLVPPVTAAPAGATGGGIGKGDDGWEDKPAPSPTPPPIDSPYEDRWPDFWLPSWARKEPVPPLAQNGTAADENQQPRKSICFVHVGKTAGSTVGCALGFNLHCHGDKWRPYNSLLYRYTTKLHHSNINDCRHDHDYYLVTIRDPVERLLSWYEYEESKLGKLRVDCHFRTLNDLALHGLVRNNERVSETCRNRARRAIVGEQQFGYHACHNYAYHMNQVPSNATLAAIRSEHLVEDWNSMEEHLGSSARVDSFPRRNPADSSGRSGRILTDVARSNLCRHLCNEIQVYKHIMYRAVNLKESDVQESMGELRKSCPREADLPACPL